jgi:Tfp pilus assembly protein PilV
MLNAGSVMNLCARFTALSGYPSKVLGSILRISSYQHLWIRLAQSFTSRSRHAEHLLKLDSTDTLLARAPQGLTPRLKGASRWVAKVLVGVLCLSATQSAEAQFDATKSLKLLADKQLTDKQYKCHNEIIYRESRWKIDAVGNKSGTQQVHGFYQIKSKHVKGKPYDYQFWIYWYYVAHRYGNTKYDEPNYCKALHHLKTKGWQ